MIPSVLARHVRQGVEDFLETTFPVSSPFFEGMLRRLLDEEGGVFKGPYLSVQLPFLRGRGTGEYFPDVPLGFPPYLHQEKAFERLGGARPRSTIVATGTGSGKTECFLWPILDHCARHWAEPGIKAVIVYPMNALATDQAGRIARAIWDAPALRDRVTAGLYVGQSESTPRTVMTRDGVITSRETMRLRPPSILLTNYKMLDYLLVRPRDLALWKANGPETLRYLVVDELHTFDGAQGTDLACLVRRLKTRLRTPRGRLCCVGTSATLGSEGEGRALVEYAESVFGEAFEGEAVVTEARQSAGEFLGDSPISRIDLPPAGAADRLDPARYEGYADYVRAQHALWLSREVAADEWDDPGWRAALGDELRTHLFFQNLLKVLGGRPMEVGELIARLEKVPPGLGSVAPEQRERLLASLLALVSEARVPVQAADGRERLAPFLDVRLQLWLRELRRMVAEVSAAPRLRFADDLNEDQLRVHLPVVHCRECGAMGWAGTKRKSETKVRSDLQSFYVAFFGRSKNVVYLFPEDQAQASSLDDVVACKLCPECFRYTSKLDLDACPSCSHQGLIFVQRWEPQDRKADHIEGRNVCPYCRTNDSLTIVGSRAPSLTSVLVAQLFSSPYNDDKKLLAFSDSVQDAAHRAGFFAVRTFRFNLRAALQQFVLAEGVGLGLDVLAERFCAHWLARLGDEVSFVATFLAPDMAWMRDHDLLRRQGMLPEGSTLPEQVRLRLGWEVAAEYGFNCRIGRTLEKTGSSVAHVDRAALDRAVDALLEPLRNEVGPLRELDRAGLERFLLGLVAHLKVEGGVLHPVLEKYLEASGNTYLLNKVMWMPRLGPYARTPMFASGTATKRFDPVLSLSPRHRTWYQSWTEKSFDHLGGSVTDETDRIYRLVLDELVEAGVLGERRAGAGRAWGLEPGALRVSTEVVQLRCRRCGHNLSVAASEAEHWDQGPCLRWHCPGRYGRLDPRPDYYGKLYATGDVLRVFTAEHTGLLERDEREELERQFKAPRDERKPWYPNLLSCTPTLEMGIDIGDLSSLVLCSVPPTQASYVQRIGRTGRRDGSSLDLTVANARPHDLYFFARPEEMIAGRVEPPGIFLGASAVLERQLTAYCFDRWVETGLPDGAVPNVVGAVLHNLQPVDHRRFPHNLLRFIDSHRTALLEGFLRDFDIDPAGALGTHLRVFLEGDRETEHSLSFKVLSGLEALDKQRKSLAGKVRLLNDRIKKRESTKARDEKLEKELRELKREKVALQALVTSITGRDVFNYFTDEGLLPNYTFPEAGVVLRSLIWRYRDKQQEGEKKYETWAYEYERPAASAIAELAPANRFYASGRRVEIDQVDMSLSEIEAWRLCRACSYSELLGEREPQATCPRCGDTAWADEGQKRQMLRMRQVFASTSDRRSRIADDSDDREPRFYVKQMLVDAEPGNVRKAFRVDSDELPFGFEFLSRATFREINFGEKGEYGAVVSVAGMQTPRAGFTLCRHCGKVQDRGKHLEHAITCTARDPASDRNVTECVYLYRDLESEAIRILLPVAAFGESQRTLHSFVAALHLGLKRRFRGSIDHLQTALQEEPVPESGFRKQYLVLHDTVPGGTGYLKQLMLSPDELMRVFELALEALRSCECARDPGKDGCYRCLFAYRHSYDMKETSRREAIELFAGILAQRDRLVETDTLRDVSVSALFDSALEARFVEALRRSTAPDRPVRVVAEVVDGRPGWFFTIGDRAYTIELHRDLGTVDGAPVPCEVDFLFRPVGSRGGGKPVAVFTDGLEHHGRRVGLDTAQRLGLVRSGRYHVWSLTWKDVEALLGGRVDAFQDYLDADELPAGANLGRLADHYGATPLRGARAEGSFEWLVRFLAHPEPEACVRQWRSLAFVQGLMCVDGQAYRAEAAQKQWRAALADLLPESLRDDAALTDDALLGLVERDGTKGSRAVRLLAWIAPAGVRDAEAVRAGDVSALGCVAYLRDTEEARARQGFEAEWNGFLRLTNLLQFLPRATFVTQAGLDEGRYDGLPPLVLEPTVSEPSPDPWVEVRDLVDADRGPLLDGLASRGWPLPEVPDYELTEAGETIAEAELGWPDLKVAVLGETQVEGAGRFEERGWRVLSMIDVLADPQRLYDLHPSGDAT
jgi:DEAD/DEAH box helicase domain-containing protein